MGTTSQSDDVLLAIDVGGTSTRAVVLAGDATALGFGSSGAGNPTAVGPQRAAEAIISAVGGALAQAGATLADVGRLVAVIAGAGGAPGERLREELAAAGVAVPVIYRADLLGMYCSGALDPDGSAIVAGTGAVAAAIRGGELATVCDGLGWLVGDDGSGFWIGRRVVRAALGALDGRLEPTSMTVALLARLGLDPSADDAGAYGRSRALQETIDALYRLPPVQLARFAPLAFEAAANGDQVAASIVEHAGEALARTLRCVLDGVEGPLVLGGGVLAHQRVVADRVIAEFRTAGFTARVAIVDDGLLGAAVLALRDAGLDPDAAMFETLRSTLAALRRDG